ncbi:flagellar basal-body rod protein FlgG [Listeria monocytogenes]|nr:flagellar basal-body rod protein FlgG [Listeria monocytogenes]
MKGLYIGAAGMMNYMQHIQVHSNNVANAQTPGFKFDQLTSEVISRNKVNYQNGPVTRQVGTIDYGVRPAATHINLTAGSSYITNRDRDFFMQDTDPTQGSNFFITAKNGEISLSRGGQFHSDQFGFLRTADGANLLSATGEAIQMGQKTSIRAEANGDLYNAETGQYLGRLGTKFVSANQADSLVKDGEGRLHVNGINTMNLPAGQGIIQNGVIETSNVDLGVEMVQLMDNQRMVQASKNVVNMFDKVYDKEATGLIRQ